MFTRRSFIKTLAGAAAAFSIPALDSRAASTEETRLLMGTFVSIRTAHAPDGLAAEAIARAFAEMARLEALLSRHDGASALCQLNASGILRDAPAELLTVTRASAAMLKLTQGAFDPTVLPVLNGMARHAGPSEMAELRSLVGMGNVSCSRSGISYARSGMAMSLDGIAKGYIADAAARVLQASGISNFLINAGGDIVAHGTRADGTPWKAAVENPRKHLGQTGFPAVCSLHNRALATSGDYEAAASMGRSHIVNPFGKGHSSIASASVTASDAMTADALATALCIMPDPMAFIESIPGTACCLVMHDGSVRFSSRWA